MTLASIGSFKNSGGDDENYPLRKSNKHEDSDLALWHREEETAVFIPRNSRKLACNIGRLLPICVSKLGRPACHPLGSVATSLAQARQFFSTD
jgi:hypothetical protein